MQDKLTELEKKISVLITRYQELMEENARLQTEIKAAKLRASSLKIKNREASQQVNKIIKDLKSII